MDWKRIDAGERVEVTAEEWDDVFEALPPLFMMRNVVLCDGTVVRADFGFAEGSGPVTAFFKMEGKRYAQNVKR